LGDGAEALNRAMESHTAVLVNGGIVVENSVHTGALPGKVLRRDHAGRVG
jgi:hypothetical protein